MKLYEVPKWLQEGELFKTFLENEGLNSDLPEKLELKIIQEVKINSFKDFEKVLQISKFWMLKIYPLEIYIYAFDNKINDEDLKVNKVLIKYKNIILEDYKNILSSKLIHFLEDCACVDYSVYKTGYTFDMINILNFHDDVKFYSLKELKKINPIKNKFERKNIPSSKKDINYYKPVFIYDHSFKNENMKAGIYFWKELPIENYVEDILNIINKSDSGIIVFENTEYALNFLQNSQYCCIYGSEPKETFKGNVSFDYYEYHSESG
uniref:Uncharacterized protein n=1 Tax=viral metagenome TaxID=1070528 RepID=A0A6C0AFU2_9ZZZZ